MPKIAPTATLEEDDNIDVRFRISKTKKIAFAETKPNGSQELVESNGGERQSDALLEDVESTDITSTHNDPEDVEGKSNGSQTKLDITHTTSTTTLRDDFTTEVQSQRTKTKKIAFAEDNLNENQDQVESSSIEQQGGAVILDDDNKDAPSAENENVADKDQTREPIADLEGDGKFEVKSKKISFAAGELNGTEALVENGDGERQSNGSVVDGGKTDETLTMNENEAAEDQIQESQTKQIERDQRWVCEPPRKLKEKYVKKFIKKLNSLSIKNIQGSSNENFQTSSDSDEEFCPQIKAGISLCKGEYIPQQGFTARFEEKAGRLVSFDKYLGEVKKDRKKPRYIIGPAGSGKTVILQRVVRELIQENQLDQTSGHKLQEKILKCFGVMEREFDIVYYIKVGDLPDLTEATLAQVLFNPSVTHLTVDEAQHGLQAILKGEVKIVILIDGLDQAAWEPKNDDVIEHWDEASTATIFGNILAGRLLSSVPTTISSREHFVACLPETMRPSSIAALVGFSEQDAGEFYCETMGIGATKDWNEMKTANPRMMFMCLNPLFLRLYTVVRKLYPNDTLDCASVVLVRIIGLLLQSSNTKQTTDVINKLKPMAFQGTQEQRVVFTNEDLGDFGLQHNTINDMVIKVAGQNDFGQKILEGMHRYSFIHQSLQEILSAIHAAEKPLEDFKTFVDVELTKDFWSVVRSFLCGILKNQKVRNGIPNDIFQAENLEEKCEYLMTKIAQQLQSNPTPVQKLDLLIATEEADSFDSLKEYTTSLDFSNTPMNALSINILITVLKHLDRLRILSLAGCGIDDKLLRVLATWRSGGTAQIGTLDLSDNLKWTDHGLWRKIFSHYSVQVCRLDIPSAKTSEGTYHRLWEISKAAKDSGVALQCRVSGLNLTFDEIKELSRYDARLQIGELRLTRAVVRRANFNLLRDFLAVNKVEKCFVNVQPQKGEVDPAFFVEVCKSLATSETSTFQFETLIIHQSMARQLDGLSKLDERIKIGHLAIEPSIGELDVDLWRRIFKHLSINVCRILSVKKDCVEIWLKFVDAIKSGTVKRLMLVPEPNFGLTAKQIANLNQKMPRGTVVEIEELKIRVKNEEGFSVEQWKAFGNAFKKFRMKKMFCNSYPEFPDLRSIAAGHQDIQYKQLRLAWKSEDEEMVYFCLTSGDDEQVDVTYVNFGEDRLENQSESIGDAIRSLGIKVVVFGRLNCTFPTKSFLLGLNGAQIDILASIDLDYNDLRAIYTKCDVRKLQILENDEARIKNIKESRARVRKTKNFPGRERADRKGLKGAGKDEFLSESEWLQLFTANS